MGAGGPLPQSNVVRMRRGNPGRRETPAHPVVPSGQVRAPAWLRPEEKRMFRAIAKDLEAGGLYKPVDATALALAVAHAAVSARAYEQLIGTDMTVEDEKNRRLAKHPLSQVMRDHSTAFAAMAKELGLVPVARLRLNLAVEGPDPADDDDLFDT